MQLRSNKFHHFLLPRFQPTTRFYHDFLRASAGSKLFATIRNGEPYLTSIDQLVRIPLKSPNIIGIASSRGNRNHQEDYCRVCAINIHPRELQATIRKAGIDWEPSSLPEAFADQVVFAGIFDGHGGSGVSEFLFNELHEIVQIVQQQSISEVYHWIKKFGGYFRRFRGGALAEWVENPNTGTDFDLDARATLAFLEADKRIATQIPDSKKMGSTASVALLHSLDTPSTPPFAARRVALTVAHCGDTRILLCATEGGLVQPLTERHHADARGEASRLRRLGMGVIADSFGETRWMGALENTRGLGDGNFKRFGVTPEPEMCFRILHAPDWAFLVSVTDGVSSLLSDQEIVDVARYAKTPGKAAEEIIRFAEELGTEDNSSAIVLPLAGWGKITGPDKTKDLRVYRQNQAIGSERQRRM